VLNQVTNYYNKSFLCNLVDLVTKLTYYYNTIIFYNLVDLAI